MRLIVFISILLLSILGSCRSSKQTVTEYADSAAVTVEHTEAVYSAGELLSLVDASRELDLSDITVEFFPPDTAHPRIRAAPRTLTVRKATAKESVQQTASESVAVDRHSADTISSRISTCGKTDTSQDNTILNPADWWIALWILSALIITIFIIIFRLIRK